MVTNLPAISDTASGSLDREDPLEKGVAPHWSGHPLQYSCLENPMARGAGGLHPWGHKESDTTEQLALATFMFLTLFSGILYLFFLSSISLG